MAKVLESPRLHEYGIHQEDSDYRVHVCFKEGYFYIYQTKNCIEALNSGSYPRRPGFQSGCEYRTSEGYLVPPDDIPGIFRRKIPEILLSRVSCKSTDSTTDKGKKAVEVVKTALQQGGFPVEFLAEEVENRSLQILGLDIVACCKIKIQVKCDYNGGRDASGNLFIQVAEINPFKRT